MLLKRLENTMHRCMECLEVGMKGKGAATDRRCEAYTRSRDKSKYRQTQMVLAI